MEAATILGVDPEFHLRLADARSRLFPFQVGKAGQLQEWSEDFATADPGIGHGLSAFPGVSRAADHSTFSPELVRAAAVSLEDRIRHGSGVAAWPCGWYTCLWARLGQGDRAHQHVINMLQQSATPNLWNGSEHDPLFHGELFQIDGILAWLPGSRRCYCRATKGISSSCLRCRRRGARVGSWVYVRETGLRSM